MRKAKKWVLFGLPPLILLLELVIGHDPISKWIALQLDTETGTISLWGGGLLFAVFLLHHYAQVIRPFKKYERLEAVKKNILDVHARAILKKYERRGFDMRINVMTARRVLISSKGRKKSATWKGWKIWTHHLEPFWRSETMRHDGDAGLVLQTGQGLAGLAYETGEPKYADLTSVAPSNYGLNESQIDRTRDITFVYSFPIRRFDPDAQRITPDVIGVVNIDSKDKGSATLVNDPDERAKLTQASEAFSELCSQLL